MKIIQNNPNKILCNYCNKEFYNNANINNLERPNRGFSNYYNSNANYSHPRVVKYDGSEENIDLIRQKLFAVMNG